MKNGPEILIQTSSCTDIYNHRKNQTLIQYFLTDLYYLKTIVIILNNLNYEN